MREGLARSMRSSFATALLVVCGCSAEVDPIDTWVGVQETNVRGTTSTMECDDHEYARVVTRRCDAQDVAIVVCSPEPLCDGQIDALAEAIVSCEETRSEFGWTPPTECAE